jgi:glycosyltransferase involved in cell wall biosynthesis
MKALIIGTDRKLFEDGSAVLARSIEYARKMEELHVIVFSLKKQELEPKFVGNLHIYPTNSNTRLGYIFDAVKIGKKIIGDIGKVVISTQDPFETGLTGYFLRKKFDFPLQLQIHTDFLSSHFKNSFLNKIRIRIAKFLIPRTQGLRVVSESIKSSIKKYFPNLKIIPEILPIFVDIEKIIKTEPAKNIKIDFPQFKFVILMASRLTKEKRIDIALRAFKKVISRFSYAGLIIAGDGSEKTNLEGLTKKLGLSGNVVFVGRQDDLISCYKTADIFLLTSEYEGYGMSLIEAGASGCPIVTTRVGIVDSALFVDGKNSSVCPVNDIGCLSKSILELIMNDTKRELFKQEMQNCIKSMITSKEEYTSKYVTLLENLLLPK